MTIFIAQKTLDISELSYILHHLFAENCSSRQLGWETPFFEKNKKPENHNITVEKRPQKRLSERKEVKTQERRNDKSYSANLTLVI